MWPGVKNVNKEEFKQNEFAVIYSINKLLTKGEESKETDIKSINDEYLPIAVGKMLTNGVPESNKGRAVQIEHFLFDMLWEYGPKKMP